MTPNFIPNFYGTAPNIPKMLPQNTIYDDRFGGFFVPFLLGGLGGAAVVGLSRPRPVYVNPYPPMPGYYPYGNY